MNLNKKKVFVRAISALLLFAALGSSTSLHADPEHARILIHTLNYLSRDYVNAVNPDGSIKSKSEFAEMTEFSEAAVRYSKEFQQEWSQQDGTNIVEQVHVVDSLVTNHAAPALVSDRANAAKALVVKVSGLTITPAAYPNIASGKAIYAANCSKCHGESGYGNGREGEQLDPKPRNFHEQERIKLLSPFSIFNTVRCGVAGTGMKAHPQLSDEEVWNVAFYVLTFRYRSPMVAENPPVTDLKEIATSSDQDFLDKKITSKQLTAIRFYQPENGKKQFIALAQKYIEESLVAAREGKYEESKQLASMAYLEGIEPVEKQLRATDPDLIARLEEQMAHVRKMLDENRSLHEVSDSIKVSQQLIDEAGRLLEAKDMSFGLALFLSISILLREGLEAFLIIMVILSVLKNTGLNKARHYVHAGWIVAVLGGFVLWQVGLQFMPDMSRIELLEGSVALLAVAMLLYIGFWMHGKSKAGRWKMYVENKISGALQGGSLVGLFVLSFFVVFREVFESVLFLSALHLESNGRHGIAIAMGVAIAFIIVAVLTILALRFSQKLPIPKLFAVSSWMMAVLAVILAGKGVHSFQETGHLSIHGIPLLHAFDWLGFFPTWETTAAQFIVLLLAIGLMKWAEK
ncbi:MAG: cytochrome c/FTR1 family iron permease [Chitinophagales bacterium]